MRTIRVAVTVAVAALASACGADDGIAIATVKVGDPCSVENVFCCTSECTGLYCPTDDVQFGNATLQEAECNLAGTGKEKSACYCSDAIFAKQHQCP